MNKLFQLLTLSSIFLLLFFAGKHEHDENFRIFYKKILKDSNLNVEQSSICVNDSTNLIPNIHFFNAETIIDVYNLNRKFDIYNEKQKEILEYENLRDSVYIKFPILGINKRIPTKCKYFLELDKFNDSIYLARIIVDDNFEYNYIAKIINGEIVYYSGGHTNISIYKTQE